MARRRELSEAEIAAIAAKNERDERLLGTILSTAGWVLLAVIVIGLIGGGLVISAADEARAAGSPSEALSGLRPVAVFGVSILPAVLVLFSMAGFVAGEQLRRGSMSTETGRHDGAVAATGSVVSRFRILDLRWHALWAVLGLVVSGGLVLLPALSWFTGAWPHADGSGEGFTMFWVIYGALGVGVSVAAFASLIKKSAWLRRVEQHPELLEAPHASRAWRWITYRWRLDLWIAGLGGAALAVATTLLPGIADAGSSESLRATDTVAFVATVVGALVLIGLGIAFSLQFWRSGERLGRGESLA